MLTSAFCGKALAIFDRFDHHSEKNFARSAKSNFTNFQREKINHTSDHRKVAFTHCTIFCKRVNARAEIRHANPLESVQTTKYFFNLNTVRD